MKPDAGCGTILVVGDDAQLIARVQEHLGHEGFTTAAVSSATEAVSWLSGHHADLVLLDAHLPGMSGEEAFRILAGQNALIPCIVTTDDAGHAAAIDMVRKGAQDYLIKDEALCELLPVVVRRALGHQSPHSGPAETETSPREKRQVESCFLERLKTLHDVNNELTKADSFDDLCRCAVEFGRTRLGFDRLSIWLFSDDGQYIEGTFGTDAEGRTRDEHGERHLASIELQKVRDTREHVGVFLHQDCQLFDIDVGVGFGTLVTAPIWDGEHNIGIFSIDNAVHGDPITERDCELFTLYASTLGHLCARMRIEEALRASEEAERRFQQRLTVLHEVNNELTRAGSVDELCRLAVQLGRDRLGCDRLSIWFLSDDKEYLVGTFGTDEQGRLRDERGKHTGMTPERKAILSSPHPVGVIRQENADLHNDRHESVGKGALVWIPVWDGEKNIGFLSTDNLIHRRPITDADCELFTLFASTVGHLHARKAAGERIRQLNLELEQRVRERTAELTAINRELEAFCHSVSHDLRAPLRAIDGFSQAICEDYAPLLDESGQACFQRIRKASQRMARLIDDLLNLSRMTRSQMSRESVDLTQIAESIAEELRALDPERNVSISVARNVTACGDAHLIRIAMQNLIDNAWKFTGRRSDARIEFDCVDREGVQVFVVRDNGVGFDMAYADKLFAPFQRLHGTAEFEGTGIGLATVQRIIHRHGGRVWAEAEMNQGASFYFTLASETVPGRSDP